MTRCTRPDSKSMLVALLLLCALFSPLFYAYAIDNQQPYYGFSPSKLGQNHKKFTHNIFGFSIDIPSTWVFGVNSTPPMAVVFIYPEGLNTGKFSKNYETIEIGQIPFSAMSLDEAKGTVMKGMSAKHLNLTMVSKPSKGKLNGRSAISWAYQWLSKTGYTVVEYITLVQSSTGTRSLAVRTTIPDFSTRRSFYDGILKTFEPFKPKY